MKDKTHSMNMDTGGDGAVRGFTDAGTPESSRDRKMRRLDKIGLSEILQDPASDEQAEFRERGGTQIGGFLRRNNTGDRN